LTGEAASQQASGATDEHLAQMAGVWHKLPETRQSTEPTYYDRPLLKEPVWEWAIPAYYYVGGLTGATLALGAAVQLMRGRSLDCLRSYCRLIGFAAAGTSGALLIYDLGRPWRFFNMLRVFR